MTYSSIYFLSVILFIFLNSCVGVGTEQAQLLPVKINSKPNRYFRQNLSSKDMDYAIVNKDFAKAASILTQLNGLNELAQQKYISIIKEGFGNLFLENLENEGVLAALPYYYSLQSLGVADSYVSESAFAEGLFDYYIAKEYFGAALHFAQTSLQNGIRLDSNARAKFQTFIQKQFVNNPKATSASFWEQRIKGTVTVLVDLGTERIPYTRLYLPSTEIGSGFFIDNSGSIITNYHVIRSQTDKNRNSGHIFVKLSSRDELIPARLVGWDPNRDLALLRISRPAPYLLRINNTFNLLQYKISDQKSYPALSVGNELYAIGAPGGLENTLTSGRVSARGREILPLTEVLQVDVPANPGNSGGPLLNSQGVIEGVLFAKHDNSFEGIAFAIPSDTLSSIISRLYLGEKIQNSWLGLLVDEYSNSEDYMEIRYIFPNSSAAESSLKPGMRIISYRNNHYTKVKPLQNQISNGPIDSIINLTVQEPENGKISNIFLELRERPDKPMYRNLGQVGTAELFYALFGTQLQAASGKRNTYEVTATLPYSQVSQLNLHEGDYIQIMQWLMDTDKNIVVAHISYNYKDNLNKSSKQSVLLQELDLPNIL